MAIKIVIVEDDIDDRLFIRGALEEDDEIDIYGFAENFTELMNLLMQQKTPPDVILCDIRLPGSTGWELSEKCKQIPLYAQVPFVLMSGVPIGNNHKPYMNNSNIAGYLVKPSRLEGYVTFRQQMLKCVREHKAAHNASWFNWPPRLFNHNKPRARGNFFLPGFL